ncbi:MAG: wax ester/triacylglycerol synthase family O-acyltransferase [Myxococcota bacterium]|nr:wax ester/triacylglycerol synthase family O-acyltransferase [Myxococcota bacterium]
MARYNYDRLSSQDASFLIFEKKHLHMHVSATQIYEVGPLGTAGGGVDIDAYKNAIASVLHRVPRYRQKLKWIPLWNHPVWIDDRHFNIDYHIRHTSLPRPGNERQLKHLAARVMAQQLDRDRPLWEIWVVEGLEADRFAVISKIHHCMIDGSSGVDLSYILMSTAPDYEPPEEVPDFIPRPEPSYATLARDEVLRQWSLPFRAISDLRLFVREAQDLGSELRVRLSALADLVGASLHPVSKTPFNGDLGPHRRFDWLTMQLEEVRSVRRKLGCSLNDLVLATVAGAVREFFKQRQVDPSMIDFRVSAPVSVRRDEERGKLGNRVSSWIVPLPLGEEDPIQRVRIIYDTTQELKKSRQALGVEMMMGAVDFLGTMLLSLGARAVSGTVNSIVTNVPGPQVPLYMLGARMESMFPQVPLLDGLGLGVALMSYDGRLCWGFNADYELLPDLREFVKQVDASFAELKEAAGLRAVTGEGPPLVEAERLSGAS